ncbi:MAG TPA: hypothetical protein VMB18_16250 [Terriglobales bacterium]|nr:hypothetical protein [Terriglobales bacterium]
MRFSRAFVGFALLCLLGFALLPTHAQQLAKRLVLKDGSYQLVSQWEVQGDRVRYLSAERNEWEELPNSMVDWDATEKFEKDRLSGKPAPEAVEVDKEMQAEQQAEEAKTPQVAPGLHLPEEGSVLLLDTFQSQPQLIELQQTNGEIDRNRKDNMLHAVLIPIPISSSKQYIELDGAHATLQAHAALPSIYVNLVPSTDSVGPEKPEQPEQPEQPWDRYHIVRAQIRKDKRIVGVIKTNPLGRSSQQQNLIPTDSIHLKGDWVKITPLSPLEPGEYAVVELLGRQGMNTFVWDFGVNPSAPANPGALMPEPSAKSDQPK